MLCAAAEQDHAFTALWTLKESYLKWCGSGIHTPMSSFSVSLNPSTDLACTEDAVLWHTRLQDYHLSLCLEAGNDPRPQEIKEVTLL